MSVRKGDDVIAGTPDLSDYITSTTLTEGLSTKQDTLTAGTNITIENNVISAPSDSSIKPGAMMAWGGTTAPDGWLICDGSAISRTTYSDLFAAIGTTYGEGDGNTTFNLPNAEGRYLTTGTNGYLSAGLPNIEGSWVNYSGILEGATPTGAFSVESVVDYAILGSGSDPKERIVFNAQTYNSIYGNSDTVTPLTLIVKHIIKY